MFKVTKQVSGTRVAKDEGVAMLATPSENVKFTDAAAKLLGITDVNRIVTMEVELENGETRPAFYVSPWAHVKGTDGKLEKDAEGVEKLVLTNEQAPEKLRSKGRKLSYPNGTGGRLQMNCAPSWELLKGTLDGTQHWAIKGLAEGEEAFKQTVGGVTIYVLELQADKYTPKSERKPKDETAE